MKTELIGKDVLHDMHGLRYISSIRIAIEDMYVSKPEANIAA